MAEQELDSGMDSVREDEAHTPQAEWRHRGRVLDALRGFSAASIWSNPLVVWLAVIAGSVAAYLLISTPLSLKWQALFALGSLVAAFWIRRYEGHLVSLILILFSVISSGRYIYWRITETLGLGDPLVTWLDLILTLGLIAAELYALFVLLVGYFQVLWPLRRKPIPLPENPDDWPTVDIFIPTYNEPLDVVRPTVLAASDMDYPPDKLRIYILDDGGRDEFREFAELAGVGYIARAGSEHAKAGNINHAITETHGDLITIFDADHIPTRSFLQISLGAFVADEKLALVQTPHHFFSPDPFERNLATFKKVPNEGELFYGLLQDGNDFWDATFFCGSCAVLRRTALEQIDGIAVETVTEDAHTALRMHRLGWHAAYINIPQAAGLATESLSGHVGQRIRWARGMAQIFRVDNPMFGRGLKLGQRLCYSNAMLHFFYGLPRLVFLTAPLAFLFLEAHIFQAWALLIAVYVIPHLVISNIATSRMQGPYRHSFWAEAYETVLCWYILMPTLLAVVNPKLGRFNVTEKGGVVEKDYVDTNIAKPYLILLYANLLGFVVGIGRLFIWNSHELDTVLLNMFWALYNIIMLGAAVAVSKETKQVRRTTRVDADLSVYVRLPGRRLVHTSTKNLSEGGASLVWPQDYGLKVGDEVMLALMPEENEVYLPAKVISADGSSLRLQYGELNVEQRRQLVYAIFGRADAWVDWRSERDADHPMRSAYEVIQYGWKGIMIAFSTASFGRGNKKEKTDESQGAGASATVAVLLAACLACLGTGPVQALDVSEVLNEEEGDVAGLTSKSQTNRRQPTATVEENDGKLSLSLRELGVLEPVRLRGDDARYNVPFSVRTDEVITDARLELNFAHSKSLIYRLSQINVLVNGELVESIPLSDSTADGATRTIPIDPRLFVDYNQITFQFVGHYTLECEDEFHSSLWALVSNQSTLHIEAESLNLSNELNVLPRPFFDRRDTEQLDLPFVFAGTPDYGTLRAAGMVASWFGGLADYRGADFPTLINELPAGDGIVFIVGGKTPADLPLPEGQGSQIAIIDNPRNSTANLLLVMGDNSQSLNAAAKALVLGDDALTGDAASIFEVQDPPPREPYDAPAWISTDEPVELGSIATKEQLQTRGYRGRPIEINFASPPDLFFWRSNGVPVHLIYRYTPPYEVGNSTMNVSVNDSFVRGVSISGKNLEDGTIDQVVPDGRKTAHDETTFYLPGYELGGNTRLTSRFFFERPPTSCRRGLVENMIGVLAPDSTIDLSGFSHYTRMPDLAKFTNAGYPFSRLADLSETAVIMPAAPNATEIQTFLVIMGRMGTFTGYPAIRLTVAGPDAVGEFSDNDLLVIGTPSSQPLYQQWSEHMPIVLGEDRVELRSIGLIGRVTELFGDRDITAAYEHAGKVIASSNGELGALIGFESPLASDRSVIAVMGDSEERLENAAKLLLSPGEAQFVQGDLTLLNDGEVSYYRLGDDYYVGSLPALTRAHWYLSEAPLLLLLIALVVVLILAVVLYRALRSAASQRTGDD